MATEFNLSDENNEEIQVDTGTTEGTSEEVGTKAWYRSKASEGTDESGTGSTSEGTEAPEQQDISEQQPTNGRDRQAGKGKEGYEYVDFEKASPKEIQERFNRLYRQVKASDSNFSELEKQNKALMEQIDEFRKEKHTSKKQNELKRLQEEAAELQRMGEYEQANEKLREQVKMEMQEDDFVPLEDEIRRKEQENMPVEQKFVNQMNPEQQEKMVKFLNEHPFAVNDQIRAAALRRGADYWQANPNMSLRDIAIEIDKELNRIGEQYHIQPKNAPKTINKDKKAEYSEVGVGEQVSKPSGNVVRLSREQARVARKIFSELPAEQAYKKYAEQLQMTERM